MKKFLSLCLVATLVASLFTIFPLHTAAANNKLTITCRNQVIGEVEVGNEFIYRVAMNSGGYNVTSGQAQLRYNDSYATIDEHGEIRSDGSINMNAYSFPTRIRNTNLVTNYFGIKNEVNYNFNKFAGTGVFTEDDPYFKIRMKAIAPGTVEIRHYSYSFYSGINTRLIYNDKGNDQLDQIPYTVCSVEPAIGYVGDANNDYQLTVLDATTVQRLAAGVDLSYKTPSADTNDDGAVNLLDALDILRYHAGMQNSGRIGEWIFASEQ